jgi:thymidylate kinase
MEEADREFFDRVARGYEAIAAAEPKRVRSIDADGSVAAVSERVWKIVEPLVKQPKRGKPAGHSP